MFKCAVFAFTYRLVTAHCRGGYYFWHSPKSNKKAYPQQSLPPHRQLPAGCCGSPALFKIIILKCNFSILLLFSVASQLRGGRRAAHGGLCGRQGLLDFAEAWASGNDVAQNIKSPWCCTSLQRWHVRQRSIGRWLDFWFFLSRKRTIAPAAMSGKQAISQQCI